MAPSDEWEYIVAICRALMVAYDILHPKQIAKITKVVQTCYACPSQWDAWTDDGRYVYIRYRHSFLTCSIDGKQVVAMTMSWRGDGGGFMNYTDMKEVLGKLLDFSEAKFEWEESYL